MPWFWMPRMTPPWRRTIWPQVMAILGAVSSCPLYTLLPPSSRLFSLVCPARSGKGAMDRMNVLLHLGKVARSYLHPVSNLKPKTYTFQWRILDETYYPYQFVEHFGCVGREIGEGWTCRFPKVVRGSRWEILAMRRLEGVAARTICTVLTSRLSYLLILSATCLGEHLRSITASSGVLGRKISYFLSDVVFTVFSSFVVLCGVMWLQE